MGQITVKQHPLLLESNQERESSKVWEKRYLERTEVCLDLILVFFGFDAKQQLLRTLG